MQSLSERVEINGKVTLYDALSICNDDMSQAKKMMLQTFYGKSDYFCIYQVTAGLKTWVVRDETELGSLIKEKQIEDAYVIAVLHKQAIEEEKTKLLNQSEEMLSSEDEPIIRDKVISQLISTFDYGQPVFQFEHDQNVFHLNVVTKKTRPANFKTPAAPNSMQAKPNGQAMTKPGVFAKPTSAQQKQQATAVPQTSKLNFGAPAAGKKTTPKPVTPKKTTNGADDIEMHNLTLEDNKNKQKSPTKMSNSSKSPAKASQKKLDLNDDDSDEDFNMARKPRRSRRKNQEEDSDEGGLDVPVAKMASPQKTQSPVKTGGCAPGKKLVKVTKTRTYKDKDGYMCTSDYSEYEEVDDVPTKNVINLPPTGKGNGKQRLPPPPAVNNAQSQAGANVAGQKKQAGLNAFFKPKQK